MKKIIVLLIVITAFFGNLNSINACTNQQLQQLQTYANSVIINYDYLKDNFFSVTISNINQQLYIKDSYNQEFNVKNNSYENYLSGNSYEFYFGSYENDCINERLIKKQINIPYYNKYFDHILCQNSKEHTLCQKFVYFEIDEKVFLNNLTNYNLNKEKKPNEEDQIIEPNKESSTSKIINFLIEYNVFISLTVIFICLLIIYLLKRKEKRW